MKITLGEVVLENGELSIQLPLVDQPEKIVVATTIQKWCENNGMLFRAFKLEGNVLHIILTQEEILPFTPEMAILANIFSNIGSTLRSIVQPQSKTMMLH